MELTALSAVSPIDGRYGKKTAALREVFSEYGLIKRRLRVEIKWLQHLASQPGIDEVPALSATASGLLEDLLDKFSVADARHQGHRGDHQSRCEGGRVLYQGTTSRTTPRAAARSEFVHFACTSRGH